MLAGPGDELDMREDETGSKNCSRVPGLRRWLAAVPFMLDKKRLGRKDPDYILGGDPPL